MVCSVEGAKLAFDHDDILKMALARLKGKVRLSADRFRAVAAGFTLSELQHLYEAVLETTPLINAISEKRS